MRSTSLPKGGIGYQHGSPMPPFGGTRDETTTTTMEGDADGGTDDPKHVVFRCDAWLASVPLAESTAVEYFSLSPFYQHTCTNESLRARGMRMDDAEELKRSVGVEYVVVAAQPPHLFAIAKRKRSSPTNASILAMYYILDGNVYQSPTLRDVINSRTVRPSRATWNRCRRNCTERASGTKLTVEGLRKRQERALFHLREAFATLQEELDLDGMDADGGMEERKLPAMEEPLSEHDVEERARFQRTLHAVLRRHPVPAESNQTTLQVQNVRQEPMAEET